MRVPVFEVLAEPNRRAIITLHGTSERPAGELVDELAFSQPDDSPERGLRRGVLVDVERKRVPFLSEVDDLPLGDGAAPRLYRHAVRQALSANE